MYLSTYLKKPSMSLSPLSVWTASDICLIGEQGLGRRARGRRPPPPRPRPRESNDVAAARARRRPRKWEDKKLHFVRSPARFIASIVFLWPNATPKNLTNLTKEKLARLFSGDFNDIYVRLCATQFWSSISAQDHPQLTLIL